MSSALIFLDTETTGLALDDEPWEVFAIRRDPGGQDVAHRWFVDHDAGRCSQLPEPYLTDHAIRFGRAPDPASKARFAAEFAELIGDDRPHIVGANPAFDTYRLQRLLEAHGLTAGWHYHLIDVEPLMLGYLAGLRADNASGIVPVLPELPYSSDDLAVRIGVPSPAGRHTAGGDARWVRAIYDRITAR